MPLPLIPLIGAGASLIGAVGSLFGNRAQRKYNEQMYERQRQDALADRAFENTYNSPAEQMKRLQSAGLNPNLVYGHGQAVGESVKTRGSDTGSYNPSNPGDSLSRLSGSLMDIYDIALKEAQTDNVRAATEVSKMQAVNTAADTAQKMASTGKLGVDTDIARKNLQYADDVISTSLEASKASTAKTLVDTQVNLDQNERQRLLTNQSLAKGVEEILNLRASRAKTQDERNEINARIKVLANDNTLRELDIQLRKMGINPGDPAYMRMAGRIVNEIQNASPEDIKKSIWEALKTLTPFGKGR